MTYSRRDFLSNVVAGTLFAPAASGAAINSHRWPGWKIDREIEAAELIKQIGEFPLAPAVERFRAEQRRAAAAAGAAAKSFALRPTKLTRREYLRLADGIVRFFARHQDERGAIVDPYEKRERQYSTPAFACAAAVLYASGYNRAILPECMKAMDAATFDLAEGRAADNHSNFYTVMLMQAFEILEKRVPRSRSNAWRNNLARLVPEKIYRYKPQSETNWNLVAASGEWRRKRASMSSDTGWMETALDAQMKLWTAHGLYRDANDPLAYDHFARYYIVDLLDNNYAGKHAPVLRELSGRAAWTSLFMQSPHGELPCGGRSGHHQWNEAEQAMTYEFYARQFARRGDKAAAGAFKRAARLALRSVGRWQRPSGELHIVKNRFDPALRHGYESYSFHSQYNLLAAAKLSMAYLQADDKISERASPAEIGGFVFSLQPAFHKVFANAGGMYLEIDTRGDASHNPTGILRVHHPQVNPQITVSDGVALKPAYQVPKKPSRALAIGPAWRSRAGSGEWHTLAEHDRKVLRDAEIKVIGETAARIEFEVVYLGAFRGGATAVRQKFIVTPSQIEVTDTIEGDTEAIRAYFPLFVSDGRDETKIEVSGSRASVRHHADGGSQNFQVLDQGAALVRLGISEPFRNGVFDAACAENRGRTIRYVIEPRAASAEPHN